MKIDGSIRSNLLSAISSARRWRGRSVHRDTLNHWRGVLEHGRNANLGPLGEPVAELVAELEFELRQARPSRAKSTEAHDVVHQSIEAKAVRLHPIAATKRGPR